MKSIFKLSLSFLLLIISIAKASNLGDSVQQKKIMPPDLNPNYLFGSSVAISNNYFAVGAPGDNVNGISSGSVYIYSYQDTSVIFKQKLTPFDGASGDNFGYSMCINNNFLFIGAPGKNDNGINSGAVYVFNLIDTLWIQKQKLLSINPEPNTFFGFSISSSSGFLIIGEPFKKYNDTICGAVNLFSLSSGNWIYKSHTYPPDRNNNQRFGFSITNSSNEVFVGAPGDNTYGINSGAIYKYLVQDIWYYQFKYYSNLPAPGDEYGFSVDNGRHYIRLVVGAPGVNQNGIHAGKVFLYNTNGNSIGIIKSFQAQDPAAGDRFGYSVSAEVYQAWGTRMIIGAAYKKTFNNLETGCSYFFTGDYYNVTQVLKIIPINVSGLAKYGSSVALSGDYFIVGAPNHYEGGANAGVVFFNKIVHWEIPVELSSFTASSSNNTVQLSWSTASELNNYGFEIERKDDKIDLPDGKAGWRTIGFRGGKGTTTVQQNYSYTDDLFGVNSHKLYYRLKQIDYDGRFEYSNVIEVNVASMNFALHQNFPNPFNPSTVIGYQLPVGGDVTLKVFDVLGREVATIVDEYKEAGYHEVEFQLAVGGLPDGKAGRQFASGIYYYQLKAGSFVETKKMILMK